MPQELIDNLNTQPLAARMRPRSLAEFYGQSHLLAENKPLYNSVSHGKVHSMILWGPPGTGKTTLAMLLTQRVNAYFVKLSAVFTGVKDIRKIVDEAYQQREQQGRRTILFVDEIHRFNKSQQDAFLPYVEEGVFTLIGATTENPSFELNNALLSRARVYVLKPLQEDDILKIIEQAIHDESRGLGQYTIEFPNELQQQLAMAADGDARRCLNYLEVLVEFALTNDNHVIITDDILKHILAGNHRQFDKRGDLFYEQISALHKAVRGSSPDASLYWFARMIDGGCDPLYIARRVVRMASEDIGIADPRGLTLALQAWDIYERLGSPEGELAIAQAIVYLACAPKSNAVYAAHKAAMRDAKQYGSLEVPLHIRNAPTRLMKELNYGKDYHYAHEYDDAYVAGENYFPEDMPKTHYYFPVDRGLEIKIKEKLTRLRKLDQKKESIKS